MLISLKQDSLSRHVRAFPSREVFSPEVIAWRNAIKSLVDLNLSFEASPAGGFGMGFNVKHPDGFILYIPSYMIDVSITRNTSNPLPIT